MSFNETILLKFITRLERASSERSTKTAELLRFWQDSFQLYLGKMKQPKNIDRYPRRYFHLHALRYAIQQSNPDIVWNLCVGNVKTSMPIIERFIKMNQTNERTTYWVNIDFVPEIQRFNNTYLEKNLIGANKQNIDSIVFFQYKEIKFFNCIGSLEDFFELFDKSFSQINDLKQTFFCLDGISNVNISPLDWLNWWRSILHLLNNSFSCWYITWLHPSSLVKKFEFYYNVVLLKQHIPMYWIETTILKFQENTNHILEIVVIENEFTKFDVRTLEKINTEQNLISKDLIFRFYANKEKSLLVYQALYLTEESIRLFINKKGKEYLGHKEIDKLLFHITNELYLKKEQNFVKTIPYLAFND